MSNRMHNDPSGVLLASFQALENAKSNVQDKFGTLADAISRCLGNLQNVAPVSEWSASDERIKDISKAVVSFAGYSDQEEPTKKTEPNRHEKWKHEKKLYSLEASRALRFLASVYRLNAMADNPENEAEIAAFVGGKWRIPLSWFCEDGDVPIVPKKGDLRDGRATFTDRNGRVFVTVETSSGEHARRAYSITPEKVMALAGIATKRSPRAGNTSETATSEEATTSQSMPIDTARNAVALAAGIDDYKYKPSKIEAESWETMFDTMATNPYFRAMMVRAVSRANKADGDAASEANKRSA